MKYHAIVFGLVLILIGAAGYFWSPPSGTASSAVDAEASNEATASNEESPAKGRSITALIPAFVGLPILVCGLISIVNSSLTKHMMHIAVTVSLLGALAATGRGIPSAIKFVSGAEGANGRATLFLSLMAIVCWVYVVLSIRSFIAARRNRSSD